LCVKSVEPVYVVAPVAEWTRTSTPEVPLNVMVWPLAPCGKVGVGWRFAV
jgi:hypothetical protein